nr:cytochrome P450 [Agasicles hygrophila]
MMITYLVAVVILLLVFMYWRNRDMPPGPWGLPVIGYLPWLDANNPYLSLSELTKKFGHVYGLRLGSIYTIVLSDPKIIKNALSKDATTGRAPLKLTHGIFQGYGLICAEGERWREHRKFSANFIRQISVKNSLKKDKLESLILHHCSEFTNYLASLDDISSINVFPALKHGLGSVINTLVFGKSWDRNNELWKYLLYLQEEGPKYIGVAGPLNFFPFLRFIPKYKKIISFIKDGQKNTHKEYRKIIEEQTALMDKLNTNSSPDNIIQAYVAEKKKKKPQIAEIYSDKQLCYLLADLFGAGLDTTAVTLRWFLVYLAKYPAIQQEIRNELNEVLEGRKPSIEDLALLPLMEASIWETMRIRPVIPTGLPHGTLEDCYIEGYKIPKGSMLLPLIWHLHNNPEVWEDPNKFNPKRFIDKEGKVVKSEYIMPFQAG